MKFVLPKMLLILHTCFFADDNIIFSKASVKKATIINNILCWCEFLSGQKLNLEKCELSFSHNLNTRLRHHINSIMEFREVVVHGKYLGLPTVFDKSMRISL